ncbi:MAG: nuclear transport factor 2 family protein, partial [Bacteroidota bacterium]
LSVSAQNYVGDEKEIESILKNIENFSQYYMSAQPDKMAASYTTDGKIFPNNLEIIEGTEALQRYWTLPEGVKILHHAIKPVEIRIVDDYAHDHGYYEGKTQRPDGSISSWKGKYVIIWKKVGDEWKIELDIWNAVSAPK